MESPYLTRDEVAALLRCHRAPSRRVDKHIPPVKDHRTPSLPQGQVARMARKRSYQVYLPAAHGLRTTSGFRHGVAATTSASAQKILARLTAPPRSSTQKPSPGSDNRSGSLPGRAAAQMVAHWLASLEGPGGLDPRRSGPTRPRAPMVPLRRVGARDRPDQRRSARRSCRIGWARSPGPACARRQARCVGSCAGAKSRVAARGAGHLAAVTRTRHPTEGTPRRPAVTRGGGRAAGAPAGVEPAPDPHGAAFPVRAYVEFLYETGLRASTVELADPGQGRGTRVNGTLVLEDDQDGAQFRAHGAARAGPWRCWRAPRPK